MLSRQETHNKRGKRRRERERDEFVTQSLLDSEDESSFVALCQKSQTPNASDKTINETKGENV